MPPKSNDLVVSDPLREHITNLPHGRVENYWTHTKLASLPDVGGRRHRERSLVELYDNENLDDGAGADNPTLVSKLRAFRVVKKLEGRERGNGGCRGDD